MRLVRYSKDGAAGVPGLLVAGGSKVVPLSALAPDAPTDMRDVIAAWDALKPQLEGAENSDAAIDASLVTLLAPVARPEKMLAIGLNYGDHIAEAQGAGLKIPTEQVWFSKASSCANGPYADIDLPKASDKLDYEVEMVVVIGKGGRHITREQAPEHVFGYTVGNDVSVRDWQTKTAQWMLGKSFDTHGPFGPAIVTTDEIPDPHTLGVRCYVNGELRQNSNTTHLVFKVWDQIAELSTVMTLSPGDVIFTGTPGGVGVAMKPQQFLKIGDVVRCEIDQLGAIENTVAAEK